MPLNPYAKGGGDVPIVDGGTGASTASGARTNLSALDETAHDLLDHTGLTGVADLTTAAHALLDHSAFPHTLLNVGTTTDAVSSGDLAAGLTGVNRFLYDQSAHTLLGAGGAFAIGTSDAQTFSLRQGGTDRWRLDASGHLIAVADNTYDFGASGATRPRTLYVGTSAVIASAVTLSSTGMSSTAALTVSSTGALSLDSTTNAIQTNATTITADAGISIVTTTTGVLSLDSGTTGAINIGIGAFAKVITFGNVTGATSLVLNAGTGNIDIGVTAQARLTNLATGAAIQTVTVGSINTTSSLTLQAGSSAFTLTAGGIFDVNATGAVTVDGSTVTLTSAAVLSLDGTGIETSATTLTADAGLSIVTTTTGALSLDSGTTGAVSLGTGASAKTVTVGSVTGAAITTIQAGSGAMTFTAGGIFDVNATGAVTVDGSTVTLTSAAALSLDGTGIETSATTLTADAGLSIATTTTGVLTLDSGTTGAINLGTSANAKTITIGNVTGATALVYNAGSGGHAFTGPMGFFGHAVVSQQTNIVSLTDSSGGAANDTIAAITNAANAGSADVGPTADAIADLAAKVNGVLTILSNVGLMAV